MQAACWTCTLALADTPTMTSRPPRHPARAAPGYCSGRVTCSWRSGHGRGAPPPCEVRHGFYRHSDRSRPRSRYGARCAAPQRWRVGAGPRSGSRLNGTWCRGAALWRLTRASETGRTARRSTRSNTQRGVRIAVRKSSCCTWHGCFGHGSTSRRPCHAEVTSSRAPGATRLFPPTSSVSRRARQARSVSFWLPHLA